MNFSTHTATDLVNQINGIFSLREEETLKQIVSVFDKENIDYRNLTNSNGKLKLECPLKLVSATLFELNIPYPPMTSRFYPVVMRLADFLQTHSNGNKIITLDYIISQLFLSKEHVGLITYLNEVGKDQLFIGLKSKGKIYPTLDEIKNNSEIQNYFIVDKGENYRGLKSVTYYEYDQIIDHIEL